MLLPVKLNPFKLTITRGQSNFSTVFIFVSFDEKGYYRVILVGQLKVLTAARTAGVATVCKDSPQVSTKKILDITDDFCPRFNSN